MHALPKKKKKADFKVQKGVNGVLKGPCFL